MLKKFGINCTSKIIQIGNGKTEEEFHKEIDKAKEITDVISYSIKNDFEKSISFVIEKLSQGERTIRLEPYFLEKNNTFNFQW